MVLVPVRLHALHVLDDVTGSSGELIVRPGVPSDVANICAFGEAHIRAHYAPLRQRIGMRYRLGPLTLNETVNYIEHRIRVAGGSRNPFTEDAVRAMHAISGGIPRVLNTLATTALLDAFGDDAETIDVSRISAAAREHRLREVPPKDERIDHVHG